MMPVRWAALPYLPKNSTGKIDKPQLIRRFQENETQTLCAAQSA
jgi:non-ribosomal peptide synthetase component E (peptide arylation enzyme)